jgi:hypothetical protein
MNPLLTIQEALNRLAGVSNRTEQEAANIYAGTNGRTTQEALNIKAGVSGRTKQEAANLIAGTIGLTTQEALNYKIFGFSPTNIANNVMWVKADSGCFSDAGSTTPCVNTDLVYNWLDQGGTGNNFEQATSGNRPTFTTGLLNGLPGVSFTAASSRRMINSSLSAYSAKTVFLVAQSVGASVGRTFLSMNNVNARIYDAGGTWGYLTTDADPFSINTGVTATNASIITLSLASVASMSVYVNGGFISTVNPGDTIASNTGMTMASATAAGSDYGNCYIFEVIVYNRVLSTEERNQVTSYLGSKWGITVS